MKHYIIVDEDLNIIDGFSDAFRKPEGTEVCINEHGNRHFELFGEINPPLKDENGILRFKFENKPVLKTEEEKQPELSLIQSEQSKNDIYNELTSLDNPREMEDLIDFVLIPKGIISIEDLPVDMKERLNRKKELRASLKEV